MEPPPISVPACLECGVALSPEAKGLCPRCLLKLGFASQLSPSTLETVVERPSLLDIAPAYPAGPAAAAGPSNSPGPTSRTAIQPFEFGDYRILRLLGKGGMGAVYEAEELLSGRRVALKVLGHSLDSADTRKRFIREGRLAASINHPNSVYVYGTEEIDGAPVITMELVPGGTLHERVKEAGPMSVPEAVDAILQIIAGLEAAHEVGILHRDIKPSNCFIEPSGTVKVGDFGLSVSTVSRDESALTLAGSFLGTPEFSSPEQLRGEELNVRSDIYSVGMTLYYLLTGTTAFRADNVVQLLTTVLEKAPRPPRELRSGIPDELSRIVLRCLSKKAAERPGNYDELRSELYPFASVAPTPATLALRFAGGVIDWVVLRLVFSVLPLLVISNVSNLVGWPYVIALTVSFLLNVLYYALCEGRWGATPGKMLVGLRVGNLDRNAPGFPRALLRAVIYLTPGSYLALLLTDGPLAVSSVPLAAAILILSKLYSLLLAVTARRRNGFATITDLLTKTRVIQRSAYQPRESLTQVVEPPVATESLPRIGPYHVLTTLSSSDDGELILGYDIKLLRRVWIRKSAPGTAPVPAALRDAARPGRLRWLQGHRSDSDSWDAYEAAPGTPLTELLSKPQPWKSVRHWLLDLATELDASTRDHSLPAVLSLDRVWVTADGGAKLLDFPAPGSSPVPPAEPEFFLNHVAISALEGRVASADEARTRSVRLPIGIRARPVLERLRDVRFDAIAEQLRQLTQQIPHISRLRRFGLVAGCVVPALVACLFSSGGVKMMENWDREYPDLGPLRSALIVRSSLKTRNLVGEPDPKVRTQAAEIFIAARFGKLVRDPNWWNSRPATSTMAPQLRTKVEQIMAAYPDPDPAEVERARAILRPLLDSKGDLSTARSREEAEVKLLPVMKGVAGGTVLCALFFSLAAAIFFRGGLLMRALGIAVVRHDGSDASRWEMLWRGCVAWAWLPLALMMNWWLGTVGLEKASPWIVALPILCVAIWSAANRGRTLQDRLAGTWLVPR